MACRPGAADDMRARAPALCLLAVMIMPSADSHPRCSCGWSYTCGTDCVTPAKTLRLRGGATASEAETAAGCCGLGWLFRSSYKEDKGDSSGLEAGMHSMVRASRIRDAAIMGATVLGLLRVPSLKQSAASSDFTRTAAPSPQEKRSFLENSLRARQLLIQGLEDGQLSPSPRYLVTLGLLSGMIWGGVVSELFSIFFQAILPADRTKRLTFLEGLRERGLIEGNPKQPHPSR